MRSQIACDLMHRTGLAPRGQEDDAVRWVAVRYGGDHIHLVAMLARQDFRRPRLRNDRYRVREACIAAEQRYGLRSTAPADRTAPRCPSRGENEKATQRGLDEAPRVTLRRQVAAAAASSSGQEFFARLDQADILVRKRYSVKNPGQVTGYAVALPGDTGRDGGPVWYGGGKMAADLTWPALCQRWPGPARPPGPDPLTAAERNACWEHAARDTADADAQIRASLAAAAAARTATEHLHAATQPAPNSPPRARTTATLAAASFPGPPLPPRPRTPEPRQHSADQAAPRPPRTTGPPRPGGPTR